MPIPDSPRVIYKNSALEEVICQLRFPTILKIGSEEPAEFQNRIRNQFPIFEETSQDIVENMPQEMVALIPQQLRAVSGGKKYRFLSEDHAWTLSLTREFISLSTTNYTRWEDFKVLLDNPVKALHDIYAPSFYSRIGLRYRDTIIRSKLSLQDEPWSNLLKPFVAGVLAQNDVKDEVKSAVKETILDLGGSVGDVRVKHFLATVSKSNEQCYVIDADFFSDLRTEQNDAIEKLDELNKFAGRLFRWFIEERLYTAMEPEPVG